MTTQTATEQLTGRERRKHPRAAAGEMAITIGAEDRRFPARVRDISLSGVCFYSPKPFAEMAILKIELELPGTVKTTVKPTGAVVRSRKLAEGEYEVALFFMAITEMERTAIADFVSKAG